LRERGKATSASVAARSGHERLGSAPFAVAVEPGQRNRLAVLEDDGACIEVEQRMGEGFRPPLRERRRRTRSPRGNIRAALAVQLEERFGTVDNLAQRDDLDTVRLLSGLGDSAGIDLGDAKGRGDHESTRNQKGSPLVVIRSRL